MNRRWLILLVGAACAAPRITHFRSGMGSCRAVDPNLIECGGRQMAQTNSAFTGGGETPLVAGDLEVTCQVSVTCSF